MDLQIKEVLKSLQFSNSNYTIPMVNCWPTQPNSSLENLFSGSQASSHRSPWVFTCLVVLYALISSIGCILNVIIVIVIVFLMPRLLQNVTNIFVLTLAFSDIFTCAFNMPIQVFYEREQLNWSEVLCRVIFSTFGLPLYISSFTILLIAIDRYRMILYPLEPRMRRSTAVVLVMGTIAISVVSAVPVAFYSHLSSPAATIEDLRNSTHFQYCVERWPYDWLRLGYSVFTFSLQFLTPLVITALLYFQIYVRLRQRMVTKKDDDKKKRTNKILMAIVACFAICWTPFALYSLLLEIRAYLSASTGASAAAAATAKASATAAVASLLPSSSSSSSSASAAALMPRGPLVDCGRNDAARQINIPEKHVKLIDLLLKVFAMGSSCINPFLYGWLNESIRDSINKILCWRRCRAQDDARGNGGGTVGGPRTATYALASTRYVRGENGPSVAEDGEGAKRAPVMGKALRIPVADTELALGEEEEEEAGEEVAIMKGCTEADVALPDIIVHSPSATSSEERAEGKFA